ncbi:MAG: phosphoglycerate dehydrogenase [Candidatus Margulisiibacteriota bacterium]
MSVKILIALQTFAEHDDLPLRLLNNAGVEIRFNDRHHRLVKEEIVELGEECQGIVAGVEPYDKWVLDRLPKLKCLSRCGVGVDNIDLIEAKNRNLSVLNTPNVVIQPVAEMAVAMTFDLLRFLTVNTNNLRSGNWKKVTGGLLAGRKVGIVGLGRIGKRAAEMFKALNAEVMGYDLFPDKAWLNKAAVKLVSLDELLAGSDIVSLHVSLAKDAPFTLGKQQLAKMKNGALLINTSRGQMIDEQALYEALKSGHIGGAGLDVFSQEPYVGKLRELDNLVMTPHVSTLTLESRAQMEREAVENILNYFGLPVES